MTLIAVVICCLILFYILCRQLEERVDRVAGIQRKTHERISSLEVGEVQQDVRIARHEQLIDTARQDVSDIAKDIGWDDSRRKTQVMKRRDPSNEE